MECGRQNSDPPKVVHNIIPRTCGNMLACVIKEIKVADELLISC